jgi:TatD DNase family protein
MLVDAHAHLDELSLSNFATGLIDSDLSIQIISNSVDLGSSIRNVQLAAKSQKIIPFVGIHPDIFQKSGADFDLEQAVEKLRDLSEYSSGIGEIGLDPKYGFLEKQEQLFLSMLEISEATGLPTTIHSRDSVSKILEILSSFNLKGSILFHWFAGQENELNKLEQKGLFVSYGPSVIFSKRMKTLLEKSNMDLILPETDSPTAFTFFNQLSISTPLLIGSVVFGISLAKKIRFAELCSTLCANVQSYLRTQTSLRVKSK